MKNHHFKKYQAIQCAKDPSRFGILQLSQNDNFNFCRAESKLTLHPSLETWILFVMAIGAQVPNSAITSFTSAIIKSFGFDTLGSQYLQIPGGAVQFLSLILGGWLCTKWPRGSRCPTMIVANTICIIGAALLVRLPDSNKVCPRILIPSVYLVNIKYCLV